MAHDAASSLYLIFIVNPSVCSKIKLVKSNERSSMRTPSGGELQQGESDLTGAGVGAEADVESFIDAIKMWE